MDRALLVCSTRPSRRRARRLASEEAVAVFEPFAARAAAGGPLADHAGIFWVEIDSDASDEAVRQRAARLGYVQHIDRLELRPRARTSGPPLPRWRRRPYILRRIWEDSAEEHRESAPDRRRFFLRNRTGGTREATGYRGSSARGERRALPVADARLLVNLARAGKGRVLLDPFAGAGGIVYEAARIGAEVWSVDLDPALAPGLTHFGARHAVATATALPFADASVRGVASEPPFDDGSTPVVVTALAEVRRVLSPGERAALMVAARQRRPIEEAALRGGWAVELAEELDRKGTAVAVLVLEKPGLRWV